MTVAFKQLRVYARAVVILVVAIAIACVLFKNRGHTVRFWFFGLTDDATSLNVVWLLLCTALATLVARWTFSLCLGLWRDLREVKRKRVVQQATDRLDERAAELDDRERRLDGKLKRAISDEEQAGDI